MPDPYNEAAVRKLCEDTYGYPPKDFQIAAARSLYEGKDTVVLAPTGSGKSLIIALSHLPASVNKHAMVVVISPLKALQKEQASKDKDSLFVNEDTKTAALLTAIKKKRYRRIFIGPEQLQSDDVRKVLKDDQERKDLIGYIVDEAHVVVEWGKTFRPCHE
ncbi:hypothetical protein QFC24_005493 [Naganishia onofrii]|uniref:Uncharacterized protein n=1 Tax=Naganishia onofrii TaxID=1851511 RepID=A0ACC2X7A3_9TREE|nr:hypothetical protein QFC24_005493 [Naganishia onofrii]